MRKGIITVAVVTACLALCAAVWPQDEPAGETPALPTPAAVIATQPEVPAMPEMKEVITPEEEKAKATLPEQDAEPRQEPEPAPAPDSAPDNMVYVPGFGWIESQGPNHAEYAENMYENGNKIGIMG